MIKSLTDRIGISFMTSEKTTILEARAKGKDYPTQKLSPKQKGKYKFTNSVACGGMKMILKMKDVDTGRHVAMANMLDSDPPEDTVRQFIREARISAKLEHPNIVPVHEIGKGDDDLPYFTMKLINGKTLQEVIELLKTDYSRYRKKYKLDYLLNVMVRVCDAIAFAHSKGIIHLDLKPDNILLGRHAEVLLLDWGLARPVKAPDSDEEPVINEDDDDFSDLNELSDMTLNGITKGTPRYMAPEQAAARNDARDERTDIYCLGAIMYAMFTWKHPVEGDSIESILKNTIDGHIIRPRRRARERRIPKAIEAIIMKSMALNPEDRYRSAKELRRDISLFRQRRATSIERSSLIKRAILLPRRNVAASIFATLFIAVSVAFAMYVLGVRY